MEWQEACKESREGIAIRTEVKLNYTQTYIVFSNGDCITHPINNPFNELKTRKIDNTPYSDGWRPAECLGPVYTNDIEKGLVPITDPEAMKVAKAYFKEKVEKTISSFSQVDSNTPVIINSQEEQIRPNFYTEINDLERLLKECSDT
jgi:hypothetical protein